jgi:hypothetical protein
MKKLKLKTAGRAVNILIFIVMLYHVFSMVGVIPKNAIWAGTLSDSQDIKIAMFMSMLVLFFILLVVSMRVGFLNRSMRIPTVKVLLWLFTALFALSAIGNMTALPSFEAIFGTAVGLLLTVLMFRIANDKGQFPKIKR